VSKSALLLGFLLLLGCSGGKQNQEVRREGGPNPDAHWPWKNPTVLVTNPGVREYSALGTDGSWLRLWEFDFKANPKLKFQLHDQDQDHTNRTDYFPHNVAEISRNLGEVVFACNGLFFGYDRGVGSPPNGWGVHIGPDVIDGVARHNVGNARWAFGVKDGVFKTLLLPTKAEMQKEFDYASVGAQCLIRNGRALKLHPFPRPGDPPLKTPVPTRPDEAGHIPVVDFWKTSRVSFGWPGDSSKLWVLIVLEPDDEVNTKLGSRGFAHGPDGGWTLADLQRFWVSFGAANAVNSDGGIVTQFVTRRPEGYLFQPARLVGGAAPVTLDKKLTNAPVGGGTLLYWVITQRP